MKITFCCADTDPQPWLQGLSAALPDATISLWQPGAPLADYAVVWAPPQTFFTEQTQLKAIFNTGAGVDALMKLDLPAGVTVVRLDDAVKAVQMAEYVCHALIRHFREFEGYEADMAQGTWSYREPRDRADFPVGIMGLGVLGERVARAVAQFDFPVLGWSRSAKQIDGVQCLHGPDQFDAFLAGTRILVNLLPLTPETENIINTRLLAKLQRGAYVINVARGPHVVDEDLLAAIADGQVAGAMLDVFRTEPLPADHPFWRCPQIGITPHGSARTVPEDTLLQILQKLQAFAAGEAVTGVVYADRGY